MKFTTERLIGIILIVIGIIAVVWFQLFAPYCATHICGCTGQGEQYSMVQGLGIISIILGGMCWIIN